MNEIFQRFDLDLVAMDELSWQDKMHLPEAGRNLRRELLAKGYEILESNTICDGIPTSIILYEDTGRNYKEDFYSIVEKLGLKFRSEDCYTKRG